MMFELSIPVALIPKLIPRMADLGIFHLRSKKYQIRSYILNDQKYARNKLWYRLNGNKNETMFSWIKDISKEKNPDKIIENFKNCSMAFLHAEKFPN